MPLETFDSSKTTALVNDNSLLSYIHHQMSFEPHFLNETHEAVKTAEIRAALSKGEVAGFPKWEGFV